jgi:hypothetical protein
VSLLTSHAMVVAGIISHQRSNRRVTQPTAATRTSGQASLRHLEKEKKDINQWSVEKKADQSNAT